MALLDYLKYLDITKLAEKSAKMTKGETMKRIALSKWRMGQRNDDFHYTTGIFHTFYTIAIILGAGLVLAFLLGCATTGEAKRDQLSAFNEYGIPTYIIDSFNMHMSTRGVWDVSRNDRVDVGRDYFFFTEDRMPRTSKLNGSGDFWYLHDILHWNDVDGMVEFIISTHPVKILVDENNDGQYDVIYKAKPGIEHDGYKLLWDEVIEYNTIGD